MQTISNAEWQVMRVVWANGQIKSSEIIAFLQKQQQWSASTIKTLIGRLINKSFLTSQKRGRAFIYSAIVDQKAYQKMMVQADIEKICQKDHAKLLLELLAKIPMTASDHQAFQDLLNERAGTLLEAVPCNCAPGQCQCHPKEGRV
ncbi:uracil phosphoribosyltransferase [Streptococcus bovimastitidis]|uniref:Uracil phosphoribosyltransferase n=1 Tax=Streptococcus bovimastitidis TaxID=1856638 RepID=A0A1L8MLI5_9STRE|nr:CopY/TcrY family copper transport repressor [Streptococcus bovimastitidis]OJF71545.1 uracil phosphoribosyltransferase [Streptococcus bovimastitidis]